MIGLNWREEITDPQEIKLFEALEDPKWDWRTIEALSRESGFTLDEVRSIVAKYSEWIRRSELPTENGEYVYTLQRSYYDRKPPLQKGWDYFSSGSAPST